MNQMAMHNGAMQPQKHKQPTKQTNCKKGKEKQRKNKNVFRIWNFTIFGFNYNI